MFLKSALLGLLAAAAMAVFPAASPATIAPKLALEQGAGTTAGSTTATGFNIDFQTFGADSVRDLVVALPPGFMINLQTAGGACLATTVPIPGCRLGGGTINGPGGPPLALYLVAPPKISDVAGVAFVVEGGETRIGDVTLETSPALSLTLSFRFLAPGTTQLQFTLDQPAAAHALRARTRSRGRGRLLAGLVREHDRPALGYRLRRAAVRADRRRNRDETSRRRSRRDADVLSAARRIEHQQRRIRPSHGHQTQPHPASLPAGHEVHDRLRVRQLAAAAGVGARQRHAHTERLGERARPERATRGRVADERVPGALPVQARRPGEPQ